MIFVRAEAVERACLLLPRDLTVVQDVDGAALMILTLLSESLLAEGPGFNASKTDARHYDFGASPRNLSTYLPTYLLHHL